MEYQGVDVRERKRERIGDVERPGDLIHPKKRRDHLCHLGLVRVAVSDDTLAGRGW